jgi:hypothetical protein
MIIELFGPPGAGKTTFARALADRLREHGHATELMLSYRPAEHVTSSDPGAHGPARRQIAATLRRLGRPVVEMLAIAGGRFADSNNVGSAINLVRILPPCNVIWLVRLRQYLLRLSSSWHRASSADHIVLFDQAFVQAVCSLVLLGRVKDRALISHALDFVPNPDLLVRIEVPQEILEARLRDRERRQSAIERLLELDLGRNLELIGIVDQLHRLLRARGQPMASISSVDPVALGDAVERIGEQVMAKLRTRRRETA